MNVPFFIARRYLFSKNNRNAINIISGISVFVLAITTAILIIILSVLNGFDSLIQESVNSISPDIKISSKNSKTFSLQNEKFNSIANFKEIKYFVNSLEENVLLGANGKQVLATIKGVDTNFVKATRIDTAFVQGKYFIRSEINNFGVFGYGLAYQLRLALMTNQPVSVWLPNRKKININNPESSFNIIKIIPTGIFSVEDYFDNQHVITSINSVRKLTDRDSLTVSAVEISVKKGYDIDFLKNRIKNILGENFIANNKYEQNKDIFKIINAEKTATFFILIFVVLIASFSMVASITMLIIEKKKDTKTLISLGADMNFIKRIFLKQAMLISFGASTLGLALGFFIVFLQQRFSFIRFPEAGNYLISAYPVELRLNDFIISFIAVNIIGILISSYPILSLKRKLLN